MKKQITNMLALLIISSCSNYKEEDSFIGKGFILKNTQIFNIPVEYSSWEFLDNGKLIGDIKFDSIVAQQINNWDYFRKGKKEFLVLVELEQMVDNYELIRNDKFSYFEFIGKKGDTLKFEEIKHEIKLILH